jgi:hypothetical protein
MEMNNDGYAGITNEANQSGFAPPRPVCSRMNMNHIGTKCGVSASSLEFASGSPIGAPF